MGKMAEFMGVETYGVFREVFERLFARRGFGSAFSAAASIYAELALPLPA